MLPKDVKDPSEPLERRVLIRRLAARDRIGKHPLASSQSTHGRRRELTMRGPLPVAGAA